jgi:hypothetical protein
VLTDPRVCRYKVGRASSAFPIARRENLNPEGSNCTVDATIRRRRWEELEENTFSGFAVIATSCMWFLVRASRRSGWEVNDDDPGCLRVSPPEDHP